jgi:superfamily II DNA or RNA helicase/5-methylcytosine-specific restriction endonuclease McrA
MSISEKQICHNLCMTAEFQSFITLDLKQNRQQPSSKTPAAHQTEALNKLYRWYRAQDASSGAVLALPTGGGKTFTAVRFLAERPLSDGYKLLWLAHTHHLLNQAFVTLCEESGHIRAPRERFGARVVSGAKEHHEVHTISPEDDAVIATLQTISRAFERHHPSLLRFLASAPNGLIVVFDEAHHSPAQSYRELLLNLRRRVPKLALLGLTATPTYSDEQQRGWLQKLFPQGVLHQARVSDLIASGVLARPNVQPAIKTNIRAVLNESEYRQLLRSNRDLPEQVVSQLADNRERNRLIADVYAKDRERWGKTLIFADRKEQCEVIAEHLKSRGVRAEAVYSQVEFRGKTAVERNANREGHNDKAIRAFKRGDLDVLVNVRMLTEGTDVPDAQTVFLTRQTRSRILLAQMVGRALRGPKFGGTREANVVVFHDDWERVIDFADFDEIGFGLGGLEENERESRERPPVQMIGIELLQRLARALDVGDMLEASFLSFLPVGWYRVDYERIAAPQNANVPNGHVSSDNQVDDETEMVRQLVLVYETDETSFARFLAAETNPDPVFARPEVQFADIESKLQAARQTFFPTSVRQQDLLETDLFHLLRHVAQHGQSPRFFRFEEREDHDLEAFAQQMIREDLRLRDELERLREEFCREDRFWSHIYPNLESFNRHFDDFKRKIRFSSDVPFSAASITGTHVPLEPREPEDELKRWIVRRDGQCLCCGSRRKLEVDHILPRYFGGSHVESNLQTLCSVCNNLKADERGLDFRRDVTRLRVRPAELPTNIRFPSDVKSAEQWKLYLTRLTNFFYRCAAVSNVHVPQRGSDWVISLRKGNNSAWLNAFRRTITQDIQDALQRGGSSRVITVRVETQSR